MHAWHICLFVKALRNTKKLVWCFLIYYYRLSSLPFLAFERVHKDSDRQAWEPREMRWVTEWEGVATQPSRPTLTFVTHACKREKDRRGGNKRVFIGKWWLVPPQSSCQESCFFRAKGTERVLLVHARVYRG